MRKHITLVERMRRERLLNGLYEYLGVVLLAALLAYILFEGALR